MKPNDYAKLKRLGDLLERRPRPWSNHPAAYKEWRMREAAVILIFSAFLVAFFALLAYGLSLGEGAESVPSSVLSSGKP